MAADTAKDAKKGPVQQSVGFMRESVDELKKVHPPTREETVRTSIVVLIMVTLFASFLGFADAVVGRIMSSIIT